MKHPNILKAGVAPLALGLALMGTPAFAQDAPAQPTATPADDDTEGAIVVTGSLIRNPNLEQANPVIVTTADQIELKQSNVAEEVLREIPGIVSNIGSATNNGNGGSSYVDLRGLGSNRNIVLLDGNRIVPADLTGEVDLNNVPLALVARVDALTGAAVTTYGADAITGVINFVTRRDFAGIEASAGYQLTERGDGAYFRGDVTLGANFDDGRGNAVVSVGYQEADPVYQGARDFSLDTLSSFTGGAFGSGTSVPSRISGTRPTIGATTTINTTPAFVQTGVTADGTPILAPVTGGVANGGLRQIQGTGIATSAFQSFNFNPFNIFQTPFKRYNIFAQANYQASDNVEVYTRGLFSKNSVSTIIAPSGSFGGSITVNLNNPFLPATVRNQICAFNTAPVVNGVDAAGNAVSGQATYTPRFDPTVCAAAAAATGPTDPNYRAVTVNLNRRSVEAGPRISEYSTTIFDYRLGLRGGITDTIDWDVSGSYGESEKVQNIGGYTLQSRFRQGALVNLVGGVPTCQDTSNGCVPINLFGPAGSISPEAADFLTESSTTRIRTTLAQARAVISGDLGFSSPGASEPIGFALGTEYRKYGATQQSDTLAKQAGELGGAGGAAPDIDGSYKVYEGFAELIVPLIEDRPFFQSLTVEGGARYSKYEVRGGGSTDAWTYKVGASWEPFSSLKLRGNYARAVRAPNISELFTPENTVLTNLGVDPCAGNAPVVNANLRAVCLAQGAPAGSIGSIEDPTAGQANITTSGNLNLAPEKATTWTVGAVFQPEFIPGFSASIDYYNIRVTEVIGNPLPGDLINACFGNITAASATDPNCTAIRREPVTGGLDGDPATTGGLFAPLSNLGELNTDGIDLIMNYSRDIGFARLGLNFIGNWTNSSRYKATPSSIDRECVGFYSPNCSFTGSIQPEFQFSQRTTLSFGNFDLSLLWRWIDEVRYEPTQAAADGQGLFAGTLPASTGILAGRQEDFNVNEAAHYFDLTARWNASDNFTFTFAVQNLLDRQPPIVGNNAGSTAFNSGNTYPATYDALGRRYAVGAKIKF